jgi:hypothetical protein
MRLPGWCIVVLTVLVFGVAGCSQNKPLTPQDRQKMDDEMRKTFEKNK